MEEAERVCLWRLEDTINNFLSNGPILQFFLSDSAPSSLFGSNMVIMARQAWSCTTQSDAPLRWLAQTSLVSLFDLIYGSWIMSQEVLRRHTSHKRARQQTSKSKQENNSSATKHKSHFLLVVVGGGGGGNVFIFFFLSPRKGRQILHCLRVISRGCDGLPAAGGTGGCSLSCSLTLRWGGADALCIIVCMCAQHGVLWS